MNKRADQQASGVLHIHVFLSELFAKHPDLILWDSGLLVDIEQREDTEAFQLLG